MVNRTEQHFSPASNGKSQPHGLVNIEAEQALLGAVMFDCAKLDDITGIVSGRDFAIAEHAQVFDLFKRRHDERLPLNDPVLVVDFLTAECRLSADGASALFFRICESVSHANHCGYYAQLVRDAAIKRAAHETLRSGLESLANPIADASDTITSCMNALQGHAERLIAESGTDDNTHDLNEILDSLNEKRPPGLMLGFNGIDRHIQGLQPGNLVTIAARPACGKTAFMTNVAVNVSRRGEAVLIVSLEQTRPEMLERMLCSVAGVNSAKVKSRNLTSEEQGRLVEAAGEVSQLPVFIEDKPGRTVTEICALARVQKRRHNIKLLLVDYLQFVEPESRQDPREQQVSIVSRKLKGLAKQLGIPVVTAAQLNRQIEARESKLPRLSDLRESGSIEQDSDIVGFLHRPQSQGTPDPRHIQLVIEKFRNGSTGTIDLDWDAPTMTFTDSGPTYRKSNNGF